MGGGAVGLGADGSTGNNGPDFNSPVPSYNSGNTGGGGAGTGPHHNLEWNYVSQGGRGGYQRLGDIFCDGAGGESAIVGGVSGAAVSAGTGGGGAGSVSGMTRGKASAITQGGMFGGGGGVAYTNSWYRVHGGNGGLGGGGGGCVNWKNSGNHHVQGGNGGGGGVIIYMRPA